MAEDSNGTDSESDLDLFSLEEAIFYCLSCGVQREVVYGWDDGLDSERFMRLFFYLKSREIEVGKTQAVATAVGASSLFKGDTFKKFIRRSDQAITQARKYQKSTRPKAEEEKRANLEKAFRKLGGIIGGRPK